MKRYTEFRDCMADCICEMEEDANGDWVSYEEYAKLREAAQAVVDFIDGPPESKRPDVFHLFVNRLKAALLQEQSDV